MTGLLGRKRRSGRRPKVETGSVERPVLAVAAYEPSVLVVEADPEVQSQMARTLRRSGLRVVGTSSPDGALALVSAWNVDLILVSEDLPGRAGVELTRVLTKCCPDARVVLVANTLEADIFEAARSAGAVGCVPKPLALESLSRWLIPRTIPDASPVAVAE
jgi:CheY-like chemotaxis protein